MKLLKNQNQSTLKMLQLKFYEQPILFEIFPLVVLAIYMAVLFNANVTYFECQNLQINSLLLKWIRIELVIFLTNLIGIALFLE